MPIKLIICFLAISLLTGCIGDALVTVKYSVKNKTDRPLTVKSKTDWSFGNMNRDTFILIPPHSENPVYAIRFVCSFSDCRYNIKNNSFLDSVNYYFADKPDHYFKLPANYWKIKKHSASTIIE